MSVSGVSNVSLEFVQLRLIAVGTQVTVALDTGNAAAAMATAAQSQVVSEAPAAPPAPPVLLDDFA
jgi:hypothetical protein